jgi:putative ABC transport system substrate-binding protein
VGKRLELLKEAVPALSRVGFLWDMNLSSRAFDSVWKYTQGSAHSLRVELLSFKVREPAEFDRAISAAAAQRVGGLIVAGTPMTWRLRAEIAAILAKHRMPAISSVGDFAEAGLLMTYGLNLAERFRRAAYFIDKILRGTKPADLPVERPTKFELIMNMRTAKMLGLTIPPSLLLRADQVIE